MESRRSELSHFFWNGPANQGKFRQENQSNVWRQGDGSAEALSSRNGRASEGFRRSPGHGRLHRLRHLEVDRTAGEVGRCARLPLRVRRRPAPRGFGSCDDGPSSREPFGGNRVCVRNARLQETSLAPRGLPVIRAYGLVLDELCQDWQSQWPGLASVARIRRKGRL